ncbi:C13 family peptidase [Megalodesulfovibrio gigas]|uniref:Peptidase C13 family protein n=1 Tax=Megalodesulfovibrio gigas (strain ATCC 19364 / DSM 1382 / NCIMB 9332 / VKM B-1759) TaxID=1121448 RepID=T2G814_MEGG1|nr:C13 family peptidase [Megalodesulfovibrio gigas]AGW12720.1 hypothetical protein DGI_0825 [Megalodesulfovibrio gigas DSM 1382 = ATCC 19364]
MHARLGWLLAVLALAANAAWPQTVAAADITTYAQARDRLVANVLHTRTDVQEILGQAAPVPGPVEVPADSDTLRLGRGPGWIFLVRLQAESRPPYLLAVVHEDATVDVRPVKTMPAGLAVTPVPEPDPAPAVSVRTQEEAYAVLLARLLGHSAQGRRIHAAREQVAGEAVVATWRGEVRLAGGPGWLFFVDDVPAANWAHPCRFVLVRENGELVVTPSRTPPANMEPFTELTTWPDGAALPSPALLPDAAPAAADARDLASTATPAANRHAVIISGGYNSWSNYPRYWNDCAFFFRTLKQYGFLDANIHVLFADGTDPAVDRSDGVSSPLDFNNDGVADIKYSATKANIALVFNQLASALGSDDILYIFTTDHGEPQEGNEHPYNTPDVLLDLWGESISGSELAAEVDKVNAKAMAGIFEQCFSGGMVEALKKPNRVLMSASRWWEYSYAMAPNYNYNEFSYHVTVALANAAKGDSNNDGHVTMEEAYLYALANDQYQSELLDGELSNEGERSAYWSSPWTLGRTLSLYGIPPSTAAPRYAGYTQTQSADPYPSLGTATNWKADNQYWAYTLPFAFPFGGQQHTTAYVSSNGIIYFASPGSSGTNRVDTLATATAVAPLWDDLTTAGTGQNIYVAASAQQVTFSWVASTYVDNIPVNVAARLYRDGRISFYYGSGNAHIGRVSGRDKTIGISLKHVNKGMHLGLHNGASILGEATALHFSPAGPMAPAPWLLLLQ